MDNYNIIEKGELRTEMINYEISLDSEENAYLKLDLIPSGIETIEELIRYCEDNLGVIINAIVINRRLEPATTNLLMREASFGSPMLFSIDLKFNKNSYGK